jgi:hypothetical protein
MIMPASQHKKSPPNPISTTNKKMMSPQHSFSLSISPTHNTSPSTTRRSAMFAAEYRDLRKSFEVGYKKYRTKRKPDDEKSLAVGYQYWNTWVRKHNKTLTVRLTKREFQSFWKWFSSRIEGHTSSNGVGIEINRIVDDFVGFGICKSRSEASALLTIIDADGNGSISFDEFITGMSSGTNMQQVITLRKFISSLEAVNKRMQDMKDATDQTRDKLLRRRSTFQDFPDADTESVLMSMDGMAIDAALSLSGEFMEGDEVVKPSPAPPGTSCEKPSAVSEVADNLVCVDLSSQLAAAKCAHGQGEAVAAADEAGG